MIDEMFQEGTARALRDRVQRPGPAETPQVGTFTGAWRGLGGLPAGGLEAAAGALESAGGYGQVTAAGGAFSSGGMFSSPSEAESKQNAQARAKLQQEGVDMTDADADKLRAKAKDLMPDPQTTGAAGQLIGGLTRFAGKAVGYMGTMGPAGALPLGFDEALTESDRLRLQGVDYATRAKAGAVAGVVSGGSMLAPMSGATWLTRFGKGVAVGEGAQIGQQEAEKLILQHAGYDHLAENFDPFDPTALAVGLVPGFLGAALGHAPAAPAPRARVHQVVQSLETGGERNPEAAVSSAGAEGAMQVMPKTQLDPGFGVRPAKLGADGKPLPGERERVGHDYLDAMLQRYGSVDKALAAYNAGPGTLDAALAHGHDWLSRLPEETLNYVHNGMARLHVAGAAEDPHVVAAARTLQTADALEASRLTPDEDLAGRDQHTQAVEDAAAQMERGEVVTVSEAAAANVDRFTEGAVERVGALARVVEEMRAERDIGDGPIRPNHAAFEEARAAKEAANDAGAAPKQAPPPRPAGDGGQGGQAASPAAAHLDAITTHLEATNPDMLLHIDGLTEPVRLGDYMAAVREEAARTSKGSKLLEVAAQCAIRS
jgi:hypothetical protein